MKHPIRPSETSLCLLCLLLIVVPVAAQSPFVATYIGGSDLEDVWPHAALAADADGNIYVAATSRSNDFPATDQAFDRSYNGGESDLVVCKFSPDMKSLLAATFLGGGSTDAVPAIAHDGYGHVVVAGQTASGDFPTTSGVYRGSLSGQTDFFIAVLTDDLSELAAGTFFGGSGAETACDLVVAGDGSFVVSGCTSSIDYPTTSGAYDRTRNSTRDVCLARLSADLTTLLSATYFGPELLDGHPAIVLDNSGDVVIVGTTSSASFPTTAGVYQTTSAGGLEMHISKFSPDLGTLIASTYFGSSSYEMAYGVAVDAGDNVYVSSHPGPSLPTTIGCFDPTFNGGVADAGVSKFNSDLTALLASTFIGGTENDAAVGIAVTPQGSVLVSGYTNSSDFPAAPHAIDATPNGADDAYVIMLSAGLDTLLASTFAGGSSTEEGNAIITVPGGGVILAGSTSSADFPVTSGVYDDSYNGKGVNDNFWGGDLFLSALSFSPFARLTEGPLVNDGGYSAGVCMVDYDQDGRNDVYVVNVAEAGAVNTLYRNAGEATFEQIRNLPIVQGVAMGYGASWADFENDGDLDVATATFLGSYSRLYLSDGAGNFEEAVSGPIQAGTIGSTSASWVDYDLDNDLDLFIANSTNSSSYPPYPNLLYRNDDGVLRKVTTGIIATHSRHTYGVAWGDYDNDGDPDLVNTNNVSEASDLFINNGDGTFTLAPSTVLGTEGTNVGGCSWADYDNDGDLDLYVASYYPGPSRLYRNDGGSLTRVTGHGLGILDGRASAGLWADYDNDGDQDIFVWLMDGETPANSYGRIFENSDGTFTRLSDALFVCDSCTVWSAVWGDIERDGDLDLFLGRMDPKWLGRTGYLDDILYLNNGNGNHWITIKPVGTISNRSAVGVKVRIKAVVGGQPVWQYQELQTMTGLRGQPPLELHFGLGDATVIDSLKLEWPSSGIVQVLENVAVDQYLTVHESAPCCTGRVGDANGSGDDEPTIGDVSVLIDAKFITGVCDGILTCFAEADVNQSGGAAPTCDDITIGDITMLIDYLFITGSSLGLPDCL